MVYNNVTYFAMTVYPRIYLARWSYAPAPGRYPTTPAWRHIDVLTPCNHSRKKWRKKTLHNYFIHRHINPVYGLLNVPKRSTILASLTHMHWKKPIHYALQTAPIRRWCHQQRRKSLFFIVATLWPCLNNGLHECDIVPNDSLSIDTTGTLIVRPHPRAVPQHSRVATHWCANPSQPLHQKNGSKNPQNPKLCSPKVKIQHSVATKRASVTCQSSTSSSS